VSVAQKVYVGLEALRQAISDYLDKGVDALIHLKLPDGTVTFKSIPAVCTVGIGGGFMQTVDPTTGQAKTVETYVLIPSCNVEDTSTDEYTVLNVYFVSRVEPRRVIMRILDVNISKSRYSRFFATARIVIHFDKNLVSELPPPITPEIPITY
jgi:hypothetical protein